MSSREDNEKINNLLKAIDGLEGMMIPINIITDYIKPLKKEMIAWRNREKKRTTQNTGRMKNE